MCVYVCVCNIFVIYLKNMSIRTPELYPLFHREGTTMFFCDPALAATVHAHLSPSINISWVNPNPTNIQICRERERKREREKEGGREGEREGERESLSIIDIHVKSNICKELSSLYNRYSREI